MYRTSGVAYKILQLWSEIHRRNEEGVGDTFAGTHGSHTSKGYENNQQSWSMPASKSLEGDEDPLSCKAHHHLADQGGPCINISPRKTAKQKSLDINCCRKHLGKGPSGRQHNSRK